MKLSLISLISILYISIASGITLQSVFDAAGPGNGYDKYIVLEQDMIYTGEVGIYEGDVFIEGNGAIVDLNEGLGIWVYAEEEYPANLDMEFVTIINGGYNGLTFNGTSTGNISNCNFIQNLYGIQIMDQVNISIKNCNFIDNSQYGIAVRGTTATLDEINHSNFWENGLGCGGYNENCWGLSWVPLELEGLGLIEYNPLFLDLDNWNFSYADNSPCIDAGDPLETDPDGSIRDIGARWFGDDTQLGDCNTDNIQNVLDVVYMINECILGNSTDCSCGDLNGDGIINVLDVVLLVNYILED